MFLEYCLRIGQRKNTSDRRSLFLLLSGYTIPMTLPKHIVGVRRTRRPLRTWTPPSFSYRLVHPTREIWGKITVVVVKYHAGIDMVPARLEIGSSSDIRNEVELKRVFNARPRTGDRVEVTHIWYEKRKGKVQHVKIPCDPGEFAEMNPDKTINTDYIRRLLLKYLPYDGPFKRTQT